MAVRTKQLFVGKMTGATQDLYTCPAGETTIVKEVVLQHAGNVSTCQLQVRSAANVTQVAVVRSAVVSNEVYRYPMWLVLQPGQKLTAVTDAGTPSTVGWAVSGTELEGLAD